MTTKAFEIILGGTLKVLAREVDGPRELTAYITLTFDTFTVTAKGDGMAFNLPSDKQVRVKVTYVDANNNPAVVDGAVGWSSSDPQIATVNAVSANEAIVRPGGKTGQAQITATADADLGEGTRPLLTIMDVSVVAGEAVAGTIEPVGAPEPIPEVEHHK